MSPLHVEATLDALGEIARYVETAAAAAGLSKHETYRLRLAADEIATNIVTHGYQATGRSGGLVVRAALDEGALSITIEDWAPPFDPCSRAMPDEAELARPLEQRKIGGLGLYLAVESVDDFRYERRDDRNVTTLIMKRVAAS
jgi:serine/threonine-protein kinase RsbW